MTAPVAAREDDESRFWSVVAALLLLRSRRDQERVAERVGTEVARLFKSLDFDDLDRGADVWVESLLDVTRRGFEDSQRAMVDFVNNYAAARALQNDVDVPGLVNVVVGSSGRLLDDTIVAPGMDENSAFRRLYSSSIITIKRAMPAPERIAVGKGVVSTVGVAESLAVDGGRVLVRELEAQRAIEGWQRLTDSDPCYFCAMLAAKGPVFQDTGRIAATDAKFVPRTRGEDPEDSAKVHNYCRCTLVPVFEGSPEPLSGWARVAFELWDQMSEADMELGSHERFKLYRRRYEALKAADPDSGRDVDELMLRRQVSKVLRSNKYVGARERAAMRAAVQR